MPFKEDWSYRKRIPWWLKYQVRQAVRRKQLDRGYERGTIGPYKALVILKNTRRFEDLLDHCGASKDGKYFYAEPYRHKLPEIPSMASELAAILGCKWEIQPGKQQWHRATVRVAFWLKDCDDDD